jgi:uncharacterized protein YbjT (DUF2867 family)
LLSAIENQFQERTPAVAASISDIRLMLKVKSLPKSADSRRIFVTGGTGYIGSSLIPVLLEREHRVRILVRPDSKAKMPAACEVVSGNALDANTYRQLIRPSDTFIHLVGAPHPSAAKAAELRAIDLVSVREAVSACAEVGMRHFIYLSIAQPAPFMKDYVGVRAECEQIIKSPQNSGVPLNSTILRPWHILGPGHRWPYLLLPFYKLGEWIPFARTAALRLGPVTLEQLILAMVEAVESPVQGTRIVGVREIRASELTLAQEVTRKSA